MRKTRVLFLCTGNSARSQMAEALLRHYAGDLFEAHSAGLDPKAIHPYTLRVMSELGLDLSRQRSKGVREYLGTHHWITVCARADERCPTTFPGVGRRDSWPFEDPAAFAGSEEDRLAKFREVRNQIDARLRAWLLAQGVPVPSRGEAGERYR